MSQVGQYQVMEELGRGAMGVVFRGLDPAIGRQVAIKIIRAQPFATAEEGAALRQRFAREASAAGKLSHGNIVTIYQLGEQNGLPYMVMEFVAGSSLEGMLSNHTRVPPDKALSILAQIADALDYAHSEGIVHRDVKPANVLVRTDGRVKITDFGIARISTQTITQTGVRVGTPAYMAPEQVTGTKVDGRADQFSLAVMAFQMLAGCKPFEAETDHAIMFKIVTQEPVALHVMNPAFSPNMSAALNRALAKEPEQRYPSCAEFIRELSRATASSPVAVEAERPTVTMPVQAQAAPKAPARRGWMIAAAGGAIPVLALLFLLVVWLKTSSPARPAPAATTTSQTVAAPPAQTPPPTAPQAAPPETTPANDSASTPAQTAPETHPVDSKPVESKPQAPPAATEVPKPKPSAPARIQVDEKTLLSHLVHEVQPVYPPLAREGRIQGVVRLSAIISKDGSVRELDLIGGHPLLVPAAINAVKQFVYRPFLKDGQPVEVAATIVVQFTLVNKPPNQGAK